MSQKWLSIVEYARAFNISDMTIRRRIKTGKLMATLKDGKYFIPVDEESLLAAAEQTHGGPSSGPAASATISNMAGHPSNNNASSGANSGHHNSKSGVGNVAHQLAATGPQPHHKPSGSNYRRPPLAPPSRANASPVAPATSPPASYAPASSSTSLGAPRAHRYSPSTTSEHKTFSAEAHHESSSSPGYIPVASGPAIPGPSGADVRGLMDVCERFISQSKQQDQYLKSSYENKILCLEKTIELKDSQIVELKQKIEDLQLLVEIFEGKKSPQYAPPGYHHPSISSGPTSAPHS